LHPKFTTYFHEPSKELNSALPSTNYGKNTAGVFLFFSFLCAAASDLFSLKKTYI